MEDYTKNLLEDSKERTINGTIIAMLIGVVVALLLMVGSAFAQTAGSASNAETNVGVVTGAAAAVVVNDYGQKPGKDNRNYNELATAPGLGSLALGGGHPCAFSPATAQVSIIGGGVGLGGMKVDSACMLMVMGAAGDAEAYMAAQIMLASRDPAACAAMEAAGMLNCTTPEERRAAKREDFSGAAAVSTKGGDGRCEKVGKKLHFRPTSAAARDAELSACKARYGL